MCTFCVLISCHKAQPRPPTAMRHALVPFPRPVCLSTQSFCLPFVILAFPFLPPRLEVPGFNNVLASLVDPRKNKAEPLKKDFFRQHKTFLKQAPEGRLLNEGQQHRYRSCLEGRSGWARALTTLGSYLMGPQLEMRCRPRPAEEEL